MAIYRVPIDLSWSGSGSPGVNVFHVDTGEGTGAGDVPAIVALLREFYTDLVTVMGGPMTVSFAGEVVDVQNDVRLPVPAWTLQIPSTNQYAAFPLALVITWRTAFATRSGLGRTFVGPLAASVDSTSGNPGATVQTLVQNAANALLADIRTATGEDGARLVVYSRLTGATAVILNGRVRNTFSILRSRRD